MRNSKSENQNSKFLYQQLKIRALGKVEGFKNEIKTLSSSINLAPRWYPGTGLKKQCDEVFRAITELEERFDRNLVVTIIGPCGSGKSTLLNALAGVDNLSEAGISRPTTRFPVILCKEKGGARQLAEQMGENVEILSSRAASSLEHVLLVDTPDMDSNEQDNHIPIVNNAISLSDVLICVFNSENPKKRDYVDFLRPYVQKFNGESLVCVMSKCDRQDEQELNETIMPEFKKYIKKAWDKPVDDVLCISARRHLNDPAWDPKAVPKHDFDEFDELHLMIFGSFNSAGYAIDRRLENAESLRDYVVDEIQVEAGKDSEWLGQAGNNMKEAEKNAAKQALSALRDDNTRQVLGVNVLLYQKLAQRWLGPVGWLIALWARILIFGTGIAAIFRFGNPIRQIMGVASSFLHFKESQAAIADTGKSERVNTALRDYRLSFMRSWPDIAESLVKGRFEQSVRKIEDNLPDSEALGGELSAIWNESLDSSIEESARKLSGIFLQFIFNIPVIGIMGYVGWITANAFFSNNFLDSDFFLHAFLTIFIILFFNFFIFQGCVRLAGGPERITGRAFEKVKNHVEEFQSVSLNPVVEQVEAVVGLGNSYPSPSSKSQVSVSDGRI
ncbi:MAG: hypothetical protein GY795_37690 [Desulfobacterales bacterium]|nr:hypothetical protein [Desulfobacterales bacterium]